MINLWYGIVGQQRLDDGRHGQLTCIDRREVASFGINYLHTYERLTTLLSSTFNSELRSNILKSARADISPKSDMEIHSTMHIDMGSRQHNTKSLFLKKKNSVYPIIVA